MSATDFARSRSMPASAEQRQRGEQRRGREDRRIADLPGGGAGGGAELRLHEEARRCSWPHQPARRARAARRGARCAAARRMALVHEAAADRARAAVQVLVAAPHREVGVVVVQGERHVADRVRQVEADDAAGACAARTMRARSNAWPVRNCTPGHSTSAISRAVLARGRPRWRRSAIRSSPAAGASSISVVARVEAVPGDLRGDGVAVGGEGAGLDQDARAPAARAVEARQHQVQVDGQRVHRHHFARLGAGERGEPAAQVLVVRIQGRRACSWPATPSRAQSSSSSVDQRRAPRAACRPSEWPHR